MSKHFIREFTHIHQQLLDLFGVVEQMVTHSVSAFCQRKFDLGDEVIERDNLVDQTEVQIEEACLKAMALYQPVAIELRRLATIMKINNQLERIADLACNIAKRGQGLREFPAYQVPERPASSCRTWYQPGCKKFGLLCELGHPHRSRCDPR